MVLKAITKTALDKLKNDGHVIGIYPVKRIAVVDGFKYYRIIK